MFSCVKFCRYNNLILTNTVFGHKMAYKLTWYSRDSKTANLIDCKPKTLGSIQDTRVYRSAVIDVKSKDHHLVVSKVNLKLKFRKGNSSRKVMMLVDSRMKIREKLSRNS